MRRGYLAHESDSITDEVRYRCTTKPAQAVLRSPCNGPVRTAVRIRTRTVSFAIQLSAAIRRSDNSRRLPRSYYKLTEHRFVIRLGSCVWACLGGTGLSAAHYTAVEPTRETLREAFTGVRGVIEGVTNGLT